MIVAWQQATGRVGGVKIIKKEECSVFTNLFYLYPGSLFVFLNAMAYRKADEQEKTHLFYLNNGRMAPEWGLTKVIIWRPVYLLWMITTW